MFVLKQVFGVFYDPVFFFVNILLPKLGNCITITNTGHDSRDPVPSPSLARPHLGWSLPPNPSLGLGSPRRGSWEAVDTVQWHACPVGEGCV